MMKRAAIIAAFAAGCTGALGTDNSPDAGGPGDATTGCFATLSYDPPFPVAQTITPVRASVTVTNAPGVLDYAWTVTFNNNPVTFSQEASDNSAIGFFAQRALELERALFELGFTLTECAEVALAATQGEPGEAEPEQEPKEGSDEKRRHRPRR